MAVRGTIKRCGADCGEDYEACGDGPSCVAECVSAASGWNCTPENNGAGVDCLTQHTLIPGCPEFPEQTIQVTVTVRLLLSGLTIGEEYEATVNWGRRDDPEGITGSYTWTFTATASEEETGYTDVPNPSSIDEPGWSVTGCSIALAA